MVKKFSGIFIVMLMILFSCAEKIDTGNGRNGMVDYTIKVSIPQGIKTYASENGGATNVTDKDLRYIMEVWTTDSPAKLAYRAHQIVSGNFTTQDVSFPVRLIAKDYNFVFWADFVTKGSTADLYYKTSDNTGLEQDAVEDVTNTDLAAAAAAIGKGLTDIKMLKLDAISDDAKDAYFANLDVNLSNSDQMPPTVKLQRPFGKYRLIATDAPQGYLAATQLGNVKVDYATAMGANANFYTEFDASTGKVIGNPSPVTNYTAPSTVDLSTRVGTQDYTNVSVLAFDYIFAPLDVNQTFPVAFDATVYDKASPFGQVGDRVISSIPIVRNKLTTVIGNFFTNSALLNVIVAPAFDGDPTNITINTEDTKVVTDADNIADLYIPDYTETATYTFDFTGITIGAGETISLRDQTVGDQLKNYQGDVYLTFSGPVSISQLNINLPYATVYLNGVNVTTLTAAVSPNTLHIDGSCKIGTLHLTQGNVEIGGVTGVVTTLDITTGCKVFWGVKTAAEAYAKSKASTSAANNDGIFLLNDISGLTSIDGSSAFAIGGYPGSSASANRAGYIFDGKGHTLTGSVVPLSGSTTQSIMHVYADNVIVRNVTMKNTAGNGMTIYFCSGVRLENVKLLNNNNPSSPTNSYNGIGLIVSSSPGVTITGCDIEGNKTGGVNVSGGPSHFDFSDGTNTIGSVTGALANSRYVWADGGATTSSVTAPSNWIRSSSTWHP